MIASLRGRVASTGPAHVVVDVGGVGYLVHVPSPVAAATAAGGEIHLQTHLVVREDSMTLFGFTAAAAREMFQMLTTVGGVGPKLALAILSSIEPEGIRRAVASSDLDLFCMVPGIGKRGAQRIVMELKDKLATGSAALESGSEISAARDALATLGYTPAEVSAVLERLSGSPAPVEELIRSALRELAGNGAGVAAARAANGNGRPPSGSSSDRGSP